MKKTQKLVLIPTFLMAVGALAGCGKVDDGHTIRMWTTFNDDYGAVIAKAIRRFETKYPEYSVEYTKYSGSYDDLKSAIVKGVAGGDYADIVAAYPDSVADFLYTGKALDLTKYINSEEKMPNGETIGWTTEEKEDIPQAYLDEGTSYFVPGTYSMPMCKSTEVMYYNRTLLMDIDLSSIDDEINEGNPLDDEYFQDITWEEMFNHLLPALKQYNEGLAADKKILDPSADYANSYAYLGYDSDDNLFITLAEQYGLGYTSINQQTGNGSIDFVQKNQNGQFSGVSTGWMNVAKMFAKAYENHYFSTKGVIGKNTNYVSTTGGAGSNGAGMLFTIGSTGGIKYQFSDTRPYDVGVAPIPHAASGSKKVISQGPSLAFMKRGASKEIMDTRALGTWLLYKEIADSKTAIEWATTTGYSPLRDSVAESTAYLAYSTTEGKQNATLDILKARVAQLVPTVSGDLFTSPVFLGSSKARNAVSGILADIFKGCAGKSDAELEALITQTFQKGFNNAI